MSTTAAAVLVIMPAKGAGRQERRTVRDLAAVKRIHAKQPDKVLVLLPFGEGDEDPRWVWIPKVR